MGAKTKEDDQRAAVGGCTRASAGRGMADDDAHEAMVHQPARNFDEHDFTGRGKKKKKKKMKKRREMKDKKEKKKKKKKKKEA